jgi:hypothetical protein
MIVIKALTLVSLLSSFVTARIMYVKIPSDTKIEY